MRSGGLDQGIAGGAGVGTLRRVGEQPGFAAHRKRPDGVFGQDVADSQIPAFAVADQGGPLVQGIFHRLAGQAAVHYPAGVGVQPVFEGLQFRQAELLTDTIPFRRTQVLDLPFDCIQFVDVTQRHVGFRGLTGFIRPARLAGLRAFAGFNELAPGMIPATDAGQTIGHTDFGIGGVTIGLQDTAEVVEQTHGYLP